MNLFNIYKIKLKNKYIKMTNFIDITFIDIFIS